MGSRHFTTLLTSIYRRHILLSTIISNLFTSITEEAKGTQGVSFTAHSSFPFVFSFCLLAISFFETAIERPIEESAQDTGFFASILSDVSS
jgi:hypothetical protein